jgi:hypothetical protein
MTVKNAHRKAAKILIMDPSVLAVEFLANFTEFGAKATIEEMNAHKPKCRRQDPDYDPEMEAKQANERRREEGEKLRIEEEKKKEEELDAKEEAEDLEVERLANEARDKKRAEHLSDDDEAAIRKKMGLDDDEPDDDPEDEDDDEIEEEDIDEADAATGDASEEFKE